MEMVISNHFPCKDWESFNWWPTIYKLNPKDSVWEDWGTLGKIREPPPLGTPRDPKQPYKYTIP